MKKPCWECGKEINKGQAADIRTVFPGAREQWLCKECKQARVEHMIQLNRESLGLDRPA